MGQDKNDSQPASTHSVGDQWTQYESNVQAYRQLSVSSQSLFLTVGAILLGWGLKIPFFTILVMAMLTTWYLWFPAIFARTAIVDFHKFHMRELFDSRGHPRDGKTPGDDRLDEKVYARTTNWKLRRRVYRKMRETERGFRTIRITRRKLDVYLPILFTMVWIIFGVYVVLR